MSDLTNFLDEDHKLIRFPAKRKMKLQALFYLASKFEKEKVYTEKEVNDLLNQWHTFGDPTTLRRELYNHMYVFKPGAFRRVVLAGTCAAHHGGAGEKI